MIPTSTVTIAQGALLNTANATFNVIDANGWGAMLIRMYLAATDAALTACRLQNSDDNISWNNDDATDFSMNGHTLPTALNSNTVWEWRFNTPLAHRYWRPRVTVGGGVNGAYLTMIVDGYPTIPNTNDPGAIDTIVI